MNGQKYVGWNEVSRRPTVVRDREAEKWREEWKNAARSKRI